jgi:hypothetical protein
MRVATITLDTSCLDDGDVERVLTSAADGGFEVDVRTVTVSARESGQPELRSHAIPDPMVWDESRWDEGAWGSDATVQELVVLDETPLDSGLLAGLDDLTRFEAILRVISNGSFPKPGERDAMTVGQLHQLRDAMALEAHARDGRTVFVTRDRKGFIDGGRRETLEGLCSTRIVTPEELPSLWRELGA